jgi:hypothetical protein
MPACRGDTAAGGPERIGPSVPYDPPAVALVSDVQTCAETPGAVRLCTAYPGSKSSPSISRRAPRTWSPPSTPARRTADSSWRTSPTPCCSGPVPRSHRGPRAGRSRRQPSLVGPARGPTTDRLRQGLAGWLRGGDPLLPRPHGHGRAGVSRPGVLHRPQHDRPRPRGQHPAGARHRLSAARRSATRPRGARVTSRQRGATAGIALESWRPHRARRTEGPLPRGRDAAARRIGARRPRTERLGSHVRRYLQGAAFRPSPPAPCSTACRAGEESFAEPARFSPTSRGVRMPYCVSV